MSQYLRETISKIKASINSLPATALQFNKLYDDTLFQYPDEYNADAENYHKTPNQYVTAFSRPKTHTHKGGILCGVCFENKPASQTWFCRLCNASLCAGCFQGCKNVGFGFMPISVMDLANKNYDSSSVRASQPRCPACRGEGTFASKGIRATRLRKFGDGEAEVAKYFGPDLTRDKYLQQNVRGYIKSYNEAVTDTLTTLHKYKQSYEDLQKSIMDDAKYQAFCDDINEKRGVIAEMEQTIRDINTEIYKLQLKKESFVTNKIGNEVNVTGLPQALSSSNTIASKYPRKFYRQHKNGEQDSMSFTACRSDKDIAEFCNFTIQYKQNVAMAYERYGITPYQREQETNDLMLMLNKHYQNVVCRFDALNTGCIIPTLAIPTSNASAMSDKELALAIARLQQEASKRGATK